MNAQLIKRPQKENDYESIQLVFGKVQDYEIVKKIGRGRYADVFEAVHIESREKRVIKVLKPIRKVKIKREIMILEKLSGHPNVVQFHEVLRNKPTKSVSLVFEHINHENHQTAFKRFSDMQIREYMYNLLQAIDHAHQNGVMHRDIKPYNVVFDAEKHEFRLIDWGLAEFYVPKHENNTNICALYYKAPEVLLNYPFYTPSIDIWGAGLILAQMIFQREPMFYGKNKQDQLEKITRVLGTSKLQEYINKYQIPIGKEFENVLSQRDKCDWTVFVNQENQKFVNFEAIQLVEAMVQYDHGERISAKKALQHPYFKPYLQSLKQGKKSGTDIKL